MADIGTFTELKNKMVPLLPWEPWRSEFEVQKKWQFGFNHWNPVIKQIFFKRIVVC